MAAALAAVVFAEGDDDGEDEVVWLVVDLARVVEGAASTPLVAPALPTLVPALPPSAVVVATSLSKKLDTEVAAKSTLVTTALPAATNVGITSSLDIAALAEEICSVYAA